MNHKDILGALDKQFSTNVTSIIVNSLNKEISFRDVTVKEQKTLTKIIIDNEGREDIVYESTLAMIQSLAIDEDFDSLTLSEFDRLKILLVLYKQNFFNNKIDYTCEECGHKGAFELDFDILEKELDKVDTADRPVTISNKTHDFMFTVGFPNVKNVRAYFKQLYKDKKDKNVINKLNKIDYVDLFIKDVKIINKENKEEIYRNLMSIYYYLLLNNKFDNYYKKIIKYFYKNRTELYQDFFYNNFLFEQNVLFFTLYNQIPFDFLPFPKKIFYFYYPIITFISNNTILNTKFNNKIIDKNLYWKLYSENELNEIKKIKDIDNNIEGTTDTDIYDNYQFYFDINYIKLLSKNFIKNKILFIFTNYPIIVKKFKINEDKIILFEYYIKISEYKHIKKKYIINFDKIIYISIYDKITKNKIENCFPKIILNKNTYLYKQINRDYFDKSFEINNYNLWFTLHPFTRILDPLYFLPNNKYIHSEYILNENMNILNISSNIYVNNIIINKNYKSETDYFKYFINIDINITDYDIINSTRKNTEINYNKKNSLLFIIWKNKTYIDTNISFINFLKLLNICSYFNLMSVVKLKNNDIKFLGEEIYIYHPNIKLINNYTDTINNFNLYNKKKMFKEIYYKPNK